MGSRKVERRVGSGALWNSGPEPLRAPVSQSRSITPFLWPHRVNRPELPYNWPVSASAGWQSLKLNWQFSLKVQFTDRVIKATNTETAVPPVTCLWYKNKNHLFECDKSCYTHNHSHIKKEKAALPAGWKHSKVSSCCHNPILPFCSGSRCLGCLACNTPIPGYEKKKL